MYKRGDIVLHDGIQSVVVEVTTTGYLVYHRFIDEAGHTGYPEVLDESMKREIDDLNKAGGRWLHWATAEELEPDV